MRLYQLFQHLTPASQLSYLEYWNLKKKRVTNEMILEKYFGYDNSAIALFIKEWMALIEAPEFLAFDENFLGIHAALLRLKNHARLSVCTARQYRVPALEELERLNLLQFFNNVLVTEQNCTKEYIIRSQLDDLDICDWIFGDTGEDIRAGQSLKIRTCGVLSGFINRDELLKFQPDLILESVTEFRLWRSRALSAARDND